MVRERFIAFLAIACSCSSALAQDGARPPAAAGLYPDLSRLTLQQAESLFMQRSRELLAARRGVEAAEADKLTAAARPNPVIAANVSNLGPRRATIDGVSVTRNPDSIVSLTQLFERGNKRELRTDVAQLGIDASREELADTLRVQEVALAASYYDLLFAQSRARIAEDSAQLFRRTVSAVELRLKAGDLAASEVARIRVDALRAENEARTARAEVQKAQAALGYLIGMEPEARQIVADDAWPPISEPAAPDLDEILSRRADVRAASARLRAAEKRRDLAKSQRTRDLTVGVQYESFPNDIKNNTLGFTVAVPLFTNYYFEGEIGRAEVEYTAALENVERVRAVALGDIQRARADLDAAADRTRRYEEALLKDAERAAKGAEFAYEKGAAGVLELLDARRTLFGSRVEAVAARADYARALAIWRAAIGEDVYNAQATEPPSKETPG
jgi:outer membrane protein, heavy metal efflux system